MAARRSAWVFELYPRRVELVGEAQLADAQAEQAEADQ